MSGSDDGTVRHYDTRESSHTNSTNSLLGMRSGDILGKRCMLCVSDACRAKQHGFARCCLHSAVK